ncbi:DNA polymerase [Pseudomonas phage vB_PaeP_YL2]|uniref:DNA polymerase I n=1 Tax=Pseudomonas phage vB_PaeP_TUMS_P121 TaxID=2873372 RepID=A0AAE8YD84_9CAUD|nr:DNA polymerase I [Pseudomonas phage vB_PaeP_TUMS_P121]UEP18685.1 DNA polymerase I [Pseudomonas phage vB_PaeP_TUMS_P121]
MKYITWEEQDSYPVAILIKEAAVSRSAAESTYIKQLEGLGVPRKNVIVISLDYEGKKVSAKAIKECIKDRDQLLRDLGVQYAYVADSKYFKEWTKRKTDADFGNLSPPAGYDPGYLVTPGVNHQVLLFDPGQMHKLSRGFKAIVDHANGVYRPVGSDLLHDVTYIYRGHVSQAREALARLMDKPEISCDIEGFSLSMFDSGIATIGFAWNEHDAVQIQCDYREMIQDENKHHGYYEPNAEMREVLKWFFTEYPGRIIYHRANHDVKVLIYTLFMEHDLDKEGMHRGLEIMTPRMDDTKIIAYLALNSTADVSYSLKDLGQEHAGNWAQDDIKDIRLIPLDDLMKYNAVDAVTTVWVKNKYYPIMVQDQQDALYHGLFKDSLDLIIQMELVGMPMNPRKITEVNTELNNLRDGYHNTVMSHPAVAKVEVLIQTSEMEKANAKLKTIQHPLSKFSHIRFNPNSGPQVARLLHEVLDLPVLDVTATKQPSTSGGTLKKLLNHIKAEPYKDLIQALMDLGAVEKVISAFMPAFKAGRMKADGMMYLHGSFNLGGTISGRLSSSDPNLQNLPAGSTYGKLVKSLFCAPPGFLFGGADFAALEDRINALLTQDPNKIKVYTDGYDGHSMRTFAFWPDKCDGIVDTVDSINSIQKVYPDLRSKAKTPHFLLQYGGSWMGLVRQVGFSDEEAQEIETNYNKLYRVSNEWVAGEIDKATKTGYVELAFNLRLRTPLLGSTILGLKATPKEAAAESRSAGNAVSGQSWGLLTNRAAVEFRKLLLASPYKLKVEIISLIHDAIYVMWPDDPDVTVWVNNTLCKCMAWQEDPKINDKRVPLGANLDIFWPSWREACTLDYPITKERLIEQCREHAAALKEKAA